MYVMPFQPVTRLRRRRRTLGATTPGGAGGSWDPSTWDKITQGISDWWNFTPFTPNPAAPGLFDPVPGSSTTDYLLNAATGEPTRSQIAANAQQYIDAAAKMRATLISQGVTPPTVLDPATVAAQALQDQKNYLSAAGLKASLADDTVTNWAWIAGLGVLGLIVLLR